VRIQLICLAKVTLVDSNNQSVGLNARKEE
jgi:hypothetical protein